EIRISLLHLAVKPGALAENCALVEKGMRIAASLGTDWVIAPELCISGYEFTNVTGTEWVAPYPDEWIVRIQKMANSLKLPILFGHPEREGDGLYNSAFMFDKDGTLVGRHRKINTPAERWARGGCDVEPLTWNGLCFGALICSDAYTKDVAETL